MKELILLLKKDFYLSFKGPLEKIREKKGSSFLQSFLIFVLIVYFLVIYSFIYLGVILQAIRNGAGIYMLTSYGAAISVLAVVFETASIISRIYYSQDVRILLSFPIKRNNIYISKILVSIFSTSLISIVLLVPLFFGLMRYDSASFINIIGVTLLIFANIIFTITLISIAVILFMSVFAGRGGIKNILQGIGFLLILFISFSPQIIINNSNLDYMELLNLLKIVFPQLFLLQKIYSLNNYMSLLIGFIALVIVVILFLALSYPLSNIMITGVLKNEVTTNKKKAKGEDKKSSVRLTIAKKDLLNILKTPVYLFNIGITGIIFPIIIFINLLSQGGNLDTIRNVISNFETLEVLPSDAFIFIALIFFSYAVFIQPLSITSITREGKLIYLMQTLPISYKDQIIGRCMSSIFFGILNVIPMILILTYLTKFNLIYLFGMIFGTLLGTFFSTSIGMYFGINNAKLDWDNPQEAVKRNFSIFVFSLITIAIIIASAIVGYVIFFKLGLDFFYVKIFAIIYFIIMTIIAIVYLNKSLESFANKINEY